MALLGGFTGILTLWSHMSRCFPALAVGYPFQTNVFFKARDAITFCYIVLNELWTIQWAIETFSYKTWKMRCTREKPLADDVETSGEVQFLLYLEERKYRRKQGWSHMCLPFHFKNNGCVESLILMEISGWLSHSGISLVCNCWVNVPVICFVLLIGCTFYTLLFQQLALCTRKCSTAYPNRT